MDPDILARIQAVLAALSNTRQRAQTAIHDVAQNVAKGVAEGVAIPPVPDRYRLNPVPVDTTRWSIEHPERVAEPDRPMPIIQTAAMLAGMIGMPGPDGPRALGFADEVPMGRRAGRVSPDGPMQPLQMESGPGTATPPVRLVKSTRLADEQDLHEFDTPDGPIEARAYLDEDQTLNVDWVGRNWKVVQDNPGLGATGKLGHSNARRVVEALLHRYPEAKAIRFERVSGAHYGPAARYPDPGTEDFPRYWDLSQKLHQLRGRNSLASVPDIEIPPTGDPRLPPRPAWLDAIIEDMMLNAPRGPSTFDKIVSEMGRMGDPTGRYNTDDPAQAMKMIIEQVILPGAFNSGITTGRYMGRNDDSSAER